jgi:hypothetical protein
MEKRPACGSARCRTDAFDLRRDGMMNRRCGASPAAPISSGYRRPVESISCALRCALMYGPSR